MHPPHCTIDEHSFIDVPRITDNWIVQINTTVSGKSNEGPGNVTAFSWLYHELSHGLRPDLFLHRVPSFLDHALE